MGLKFRVWGVWVEVLECGVQGVAEGGGVPELLGLDTLGFRFRIWGSGCWDEERVRGVAREGCVSVLLGL